MWKGVKGIPPQRGCLREGAEAGRGREVWGTREMSWAGCGAKTVLAGKTGTEFHVTGYPEGSNNLIGASRPHNPSIKGAGVSFKPRTKTWLYPLLAMRCRQVPGPP